MFNTKTVFIVGAGASMDVGLPQSLTIVIIAYALAAKQGD